MVLNVLMFSKLHDFSLFRVKILTSKTNLIAKCLMVCLGLVTSQRYVVSFIFVKMIKPLELTTPLPGYLCRPRSLGKNKTTISKIKTIC